MLIYPISIQERDIIEALYFEKNAKEHLLTIISQQNNLVNNEIFERIYQEAVQANVAFNSCFDTILSKHASKMLRYKNAKIDFISCELIVEEV